jgi:hypothetical protein
MVRGTLLCWFVFFTLDEWRGVENGPGCERDSTFFRLWSDDRYWGRVLGFGRHRMSDETGLV